MLIKNTTAAKKILELPGVAMKVTFRKKDGSLREMRFDYERKTDEATGAAIDTVESVTKSGRLTVRDLDLVDLGKPAYRKINLNEIISLTINGKVFKVIGGDDFKSYLFSTADMRKTIDARTEAEAREKLKAALGVKRLPAGLTSSIILAEKAIEKPVKGYTDRDSPSLYGDLS